MKVHTEFLSMAASTTTKKKKRLIRHICQGYPHHGTGSSPAEEKSTDYNRMSQNL